MFRLFDLLSPRECPGCGRRLMADEETLCHRCMLYLPFYIPPSPAPSFFLDNPMARMFWGLFQLEKAAAYFYYEPGGIAAQLIHHIKYFGRKDLAVSLGELFAKRLTDIRFDEPRCNFFDGIDVIVPVPLAKERQQQRGYNQSELIARGIAQVTGIPLCLTAMGRRSFEGSQTRLNAVERRENVEHAFRLMDAGEITGKHILLVDDVMTTGATLKACSEQLNTAEGVTISIATLGYTKT